MKLKVHHTCHKISEMVTITTFQFVFLSVLVAAVPTQALHPLSDEFIDLINQKQSSWTAGRNFHPQTPLKYVIGLLGLKKGLRDDENIPRIIHDDDMIASLPEHFDARERWPQCPSLREIRDQGSCGSCWAISAVEAITDRVCIFSNGTDHFHFSTQDVTSCAHGWGCDGGTVIEPWYYWVEHGIVSGGEYGSNEGCRPYEILPCEHHISGSRPKCTGIVDTPECKTTCREGYNVSYAQDKRQGSSYYLLAGEQNIMAEIYKNGPVEAHLDVYGDFLNYKKGVYKSNGSGGVLGGHAVKILGWGVENDLKYWLVANSWNNDWGDHGYFKILRGVNHCRIEENCGAGLPK